ncbi:MAG: hypothetical protein SWK90_11100, partial [Chloroflexota bacterium]|nr:hypothetical protein [Chloroflexota bacterium]
MILDTIAPVIPHLRHVTIDEAQLREVCARLPRPASDRALPATLRLPTWDDDVFILHPPEARAAQLLLFNTINFSYWVGILIKPCHPAYTARRQPFPHPLPPASPERQACPLPA